MDWREERTKWKRATPHTHQIYDEKTNVIDEVKISFGWSFCTFGTIFYRPYNLTPDHPCFLLTFLQQSHFLTITVNLQHISVFASATFNLTLLWLRWSFHKKVLGIDALVKRLLKVFEDAPFDLRPFPSLLKFSRIATRIYNLGFLYN